MICPNCNCNNPDGAKFCKECGKSMGSGVIDSSKALSTHTNTVAATNPQKKPYSVYWRFNNSREAKFYFIITDRSIIERRAVRGVITDAEYPYSALDPIELTNVPHGLINGVAVTRVNGQYISWGFLTADAEKFMHAVEYANYQIDLAHGRRKNYYFVFQSDLCNKIEVYDGYVIAYSIQGGGKASASFILSNGATGGMHGRIVKFDELTVALNPSNGLVRFLLKDDTIPIDIQLTKENYIKGSEIVDYINRRKASPKEEVINISAVNEKWTTISGVKREFKIEDKVLVISEEMDQFNSYLMKFRALASECTDELIKECTNKINNLLTFYNFFPWTFDKYLDVMIGKVIDILISEGIWDVTHESLKEFHYEQGFRYVIKCLTTLTMGVLKTIENNNSSTYATIMGSLSKADSYLVSITPYQQNELYGRIKFDDLYYIVFQEYQSLAFTLAYYLKESGKAIWFPDKDTSKAKNIFQNISHPNFPEDKRLEVFLEILQTSPYNADYHKYMLKQWGENDQTNAIKSYFGFTDFTNRRELF